MKVICAWCGTVKKEAEGDNDSRVSHGICAICADRQIAEMLARKEENDETGRSACVEY